MRPLVAVVTDSTASLPPEVAVEEGIAVVPLHVHCGDEDLLDLPEQRGRIAERLRAGVLGTTSQPAPETFARTYRELAEAGAQAIVSIHISGELSGTVRSAREAAARAPVPVEVLDTRSVAFGTGAAAVVAARVAAAGGDLARVAAEARTTAAGTAVFFAVHDLGYLHRGGRIGAAQAMVGTMLGARPVLHMEDGRIAAKETVRGAGRALRRLVELAVAEASASWPVLAAVHHFAAEAEARELARALADALRSAGRRPVAGHPLIAEVSAVVGVHTGPGVLGVVVAPAVHSPA